MEEAMIEPNWQPILTDEQRVVLRPLKEEDFEALYAVASDPLIWEQHPNPDRYKFEVFRTYFKGAIESKGAFLILNHENQEILGCTRFYDVEPEKDQIKIGYTFFSRSCWGRGINPLVKKLMIDHAFQFVSTIIFHVGEKNIRSRIAMERLGATYIGEEEVSYYGESPKRNIVYRLTIEER